MINSLWVAGVSLFLAADSTRVLPLAEFLRTVATHHPIARQAELLGTVAGEQERAQRGKLDPLLAARWETKRFQGSDYYQYLDADLKLPTPLGFDIKVGYERARGEFIASDRRTPGNGLFTAGVAIPLNRRLVVDERRAAVAQARAMREYAAGERAAMVTKLLSSAVTAYADWYEGQARLALADSGVRLAAFRLDGLRRRVAAGDAAAIDTVEAALELQRRKVQREEAKIVRLTTGLIVEGLLWDARGGPVALDSSSIPELRPQWARVVTGEFPKFSAPEHPDVQKTRAKVREIEPTRDLALQRLLVPDATVEAAALSTNRGTPNDFVERDRKVSLSLELPLLLRSARGALGVVDARREQLQLDQAMATRGVALAVEAARAELAALGEMVALQQTAVAHATRLRDAELRKFDAGESTLFLVTARERAVLDEGVRQISLEAKQLASLGKLSVALGVPLATR